MYRVIFFLLTFAMIPFLGFGAKLADSVAEVEITTIAQENQGNSYLTFPTDIGNIEPLWFEANLIPNFYIRQSKSSRLMAVLTPQIIIRMLREESFPIRTPSYMPQLSVYYDLKNIASLRSFLYGRIGHHSNGQENAFLSDSGTINLINGNFATNFFEAGVVASRYSERFQAFQFFKTSLEVHPSALVQEELLGRYSRYRWHNDFSVFRLSADTKTDKNRKPALSLKAETVWMFGDYGNLPQLSIERLNLKLTFYYHPGFLEDIGFFVQYYHGSDYYNIYFDHRIDVLRFGLMTEKIRF